MLNGHCNVRLLVLAALLFLTFGCRNGFDQDETFTLSFKTLFVRSTDSTGTHLTMLEPAGIYPGREVSFGVRSGKLGGTDLKDNRLWIGDADAKTIALWELPSRRIYSRGLDIVPHIVAAGDRYLLVADTTAQVFRFYRISDLNAAPYQDTGKVTAALMNGGKVCIAFHGRVEVWDESALVRQFTTSYPGYRFNSIYLDASRNFQLQASDTAGIWLSRADTWAGRAYLPVLVEHAAFQRYSWISYRQYQTELLHEVVVSNGMLTVGGAAIDSADAAAPAFFPGIIWYRRGDSVFRWDGSTRQFSGTDPGHWEGQHEYIDMQ